jgi:hypothetical protein
MVEEKTQILYKARLIKLHNKQSKNRKSYFSLETDKGQLSFFDGGLADLVKTKIGCLCDLELIENGPYMNLCGVINTHEEVNMAPASELEQVMFRDDRQVSIEAQMIIKAAVELAKSQIELANKMNLRIDSKDIADFIENNRVMLIKKFKETKTDL